MSSAYQKPEGILSTSLIFVLSGGKDFLLELIKQRELNSLRVVFMSEKDKDYSHIRCKRSGNKYS